MDNLTVVALDQLDGFDLTNVNTNRPIIKDGHIAEVAFTGVETKEAKKGGKNAQFKFTLTEDAPTRDGKTVRAGFVCVETVSLTPTENYNPAERLAAMQECFIGAKGKWDTASMTNQKGKVRFKIEASDEFGDRNRIAAFLKRKAAGTTPTLS